MALGPKQMGEAILRNLKSKTGKTADEWVKIIQEEKLREKKEVVTYLKQNKGLGHFQAQKVYEYLSQSNLYEDPDRLINQLFTTEASRQLFDQIRNHICELGSDVKVRPCQTYIPFYRKTQFAAVAPTKDDGIRLGVFLPEDHSYPRFSHQSSIGSQRINAEIEIKTIEEFRNIASSPVREAYLNN